MMWRLWAWIRERVGRVRVAYPVVNSEGIQIAPWCAFLP